MKNCARYTILHFKLAELCSQHNTALQTCRTVLFTQYYTSNLPNCARYTILHFKLAELCSQHNTALQTCRTVLFTQYYTSNLPNCARYTILHFKLAEMCTLFVWCFSPSHTCVCQSRHNRIIASHWYDSAMSRTLTPYTRSGRCSLYPINFHVCFRLLWR